MVEIEKVSAGAHGNKAKYRIVTATKSGKSVVATLDSLEKAGCVLRFIHGANIKGDEYMLAVQTMREIDAAGGLDDETERVSGETDIGVSDGNPSD